MIDINPQQFYHDLLSCKKSPHTHSPSIKNVLIEVDGDKYSDVILIPMIFDISSFELVLSSIGKNINTYLFAAELFLSNVPPVIILEKFQKLRDSTKTFFCV